jgi:hypothetical protein
VTWSEGYGGTPPWWVDYCLMAERFGGWPWEIDDVPAVWVIRAKYYDRQMRKKEAEWLTKKP